MTNVVRIRREEDSKLALFAPGFLFEPLGWIMDWLKGAVQSDPTLLADVYSLTHVAVPFPDDDPLYGSHAAESSKIVNLGRLSPRGEKGVLTVPTEVLMRLSSNPFFGVVAERTKTFVGR